MVVLPTRSMTNLAVDWGPVGLWVSATLTFLALVVTALVALGFFDYLRGPRIRITFEPIEPWCRQGGREDGSPSNETGTAGRSGRPRARKPRKRKESPGDE